MMNLSSVLKNNIHGNAYLRLKEISALSRSFHLYPYLVGGVVRDLLLAVPVKEDLDVTVTGGAVAPLAEALAAQWNAKLYRYPDFLTFTIEFKDQTHLDLITARREIYPFPASLPVVEAGSLEMDLLRRDFSINAIALSLSKESWGEILDPLNGIEDIRKKEIRVLHPKSFVDDPTRIFRAARFAARFNFKIERTTHRCLRQSVKTKMISNLSRDRVRVELEKILLEEKPSAALRWLSRWEVLEPIDPLLVSTPNKFKNLDRVQAGDPDFSLAVKISLWLLGKPANEAGRFFNKLNFQKKLREKVMQALNLHRSFIEKKTIFSLPCSGLFPETVYFFNLWTSLERGKRVRRPWALYQRWLKSKPILDGEDLKELGYAPGPNFQAILSSLQKAKFERKLKTRRDELRFVIDNFRRA